MKNLAVCLHLFYFEQFDEIKKRLSKLKDVDFDLFVTMVCDEECVKEKILKLYPNAKIFVVENRGYDIGPFVYFLHQINLDDYKYVLKLHTKGKKGYAGTLIKNRRLSNALWGKIMWESLLGSKKRLGANLKMLEENNRIGMIGSAYCFSDEYKHYYHLLEDINVAMKKMGFDEVANLSFIAGCMFVCRAELLKPLLSYSLCDFDATDGKIKDETLAHVVERLFGAIVEAEGYEVVGVKHDNYALWFWWIAFKRFLFQKKVTKSGKMMVKICRIPVFVKYVEV